jgi:Tfp pilus assembly protein PilF
VDEHFMQSREAGLSLDNLRKRAEAHLQGNNLPAARSLLEALVASSPTDLPAHLDLAHVLMKSGSFRASAACLADAAASADGASTASLITLARRLYFSGEAVVARQCIEHLGQAIRPDGPSLAAVAHLYWLLGDVATAGEYIHRARQAGVDTPNEWHLHAMLCHFQGERERAREILEACLQRWPRFGAAAQALANLGTCRADRHHVPFLRAQLEQLPRDLSDPSAAMVRAQFLSALSKELDDLDDTAASWDALVESKAIMRRLNPYDPAMESTLTTELLAAAAALPPLKETASKASTGEEPLPIFVVGLPRSGSTLLDRVLSSHPDVASAGEINDFLRQLHWVADVPPSGVAGMREVLRRTRQLDLAELGRRYLAQTRWRAKGRRYFVDKLPINIQLVPIIRRALPDAPILHIVRDPMDVCFSNFRAMFGDVSPWCNDLAAVAHYHGEYRRIVSQWHADYPSAMLDVDYRALVEDPEPTTRAILAHCGLTFDERCLHPERNPAPVATPSAAQVREPMHRRGLASWRRYAAQLAPLRDALVSA